MVEKKNGMHIFIKENNSDEKRLNNQKKTHVFSCSINSNWNCMWTKILLSWLPVLQTIYCFNQYINIYMYQCIFLFHIIVHVLSAQRPLFTFQRFTFTIIQIHNTHSMKLLNRTCACTSATWLWTYIQYQCIFLCFNISKNKTEDPVVTTMDYALSLNTCLFNHKWSGNSCVDISHTSSLLNSQDGVL